MYTSKISGSSFVTSPSELQVSSPHEEAVHSLGKRLSEDEKSFILDEIQMMEKEGKPFSYIKDFVAQFLQKHDGKISSRKFSSDDSQKLHLSDSANDSSREKFANDVSKEEKSFLLDEIETMLAEGKSFLDVKNFFNEFLLEKGIENPNEKGFFVNKMA